MIAWISDNAQFLNVAINAFLMIIWAVYLNLFLYSMKRTSRPMLMVSRGAGSGPEARLFLSNMGAEPIYVSALIADVECGGETVSVTITENHEFRSDELSSPAEATTEGPLGSGQYTDAGSFGDLMKRISRHAENVDPEKVERITLTLVAATGHSAALSAGRKSYRLVRHNGTTTFHPERVSTEQLHSRLARRRIHKRLNRFLAAELPD